MTPPDEPRGADLARLTLRRAQADAAKRPAGATKVRGPRRAAVRSSDRDPVGLAAALGGLVEQHAWNAPLSGGAVTDLWPRAAGELAPHTRAVAFDHTTGRLDVQADSPAYATHLRHFAAHLVAEINRLHQQPVVRTIRVLAERGSRTTAGPVPSGATAPGRRPPGPVRTRENASPGYQRALAQLQAARARVPADPLAGPAIEHKVRALARATPAPATSS
ncbi:DciA family protein [Kitasatospora sp. NPDC059973]|uniref:DciA family protein n=1 Tax=Kitasatospora sp. NPDC059973 TaxID=3347020 RepID=UPI0036BA93E6